MDDIDFDVAPELDVIRHKRDRRKGHTTRFVSYQSHTQGDNSIAILESFNGLTGNEVGIKSLEYGGRWKIMDFRTSTTPFIPKIQYLRRPSISYLERHYKRSNGWGHWLWSSNGKTLSFTCTCDSTHAAIPCGRHGRKKPQFLKEKGFCSMVPEYAVVQEQEIEKALNVSFPSEPAPELSPESKRYLQHLIRQYEVRKATAEAQKADSRESLLNSSSTTSTTIQVESIDYSLLKSREIPIPDAPLWVVVFQESYEIDHGASGLCADLMIEKLIKFEIPYIRVQISPQAYSTHVGFRSLGVFSRYHDTSRRWERRDKEKKRRKYQDSGASKADFQFSGR